MRQKRLLGVFLSVFLTMTLLSGCGREKETTEAFEMTEILESTTESLEDLEGSLATETDALVEETAEADLVQLEENWEGTPLKETEKSQYTSLLVTINPKVCLYLNQDNTVVAVEYLNRDAKDAYGSEKLVGLDAKEAVKSIVDTAVTKEYLTESNNMVSISVENPAIGSESDETDEVLKAVEESAAEALQQLSYGTSVNGTNVPAVSADGTGNEVQVQGKQEESVEESKAVSTSPCSTCGGTGKCDECKGDGYRGTGYSVPCPRCKGSLTETCIYCDEAGNSKKHEGTCDFPNCMGSHVYACTICGGGTRPVTCESCGGSGKCKTCGGSGTM